MQEGAVLEMRGISKYFPGVRALQGVDFTLREGEIHALMGENGAGKSTLIKVLTGVYAKDEGQIFLKGKEGPVSIKSPQDAQNVGISTVYQEITLCPNLTVAENMFIARTKGPGVNWRSINRRAGEILRSLDIPVSPTQQLGSCSIAVQQMVAIARAVDMECKVLILDEPTSSLDEQEVQKLFKLMLDLKKKGVGIIFVTHFLEQVYEVCDRITVLRDGQLVGEYVIEDLPRVQLVSKMLGKELDEMADIKKEHAGTVDMSDDGVVLEVHDLASVAGIKPFDFHIRKGEVNGFTGLLGSGRSESVRAIFGADRTTGGTIKIGGKEVKIHKPLDAMKHGVGYLPEDRKRDGIVGDLSVRENIILMLNENAALIILSCGMSLVMITGGIDISVGTMTALVCMTCAVNLDYQAGTVASAIGLALMIGVLYGLVQGYIIAYLEIQPFIVTLAGMFFAKGMTTIVNADQFNVVNESFQALKLTRINVPGMGSVNKLGKYVPAYVEIGVLVALVVVVLLFVMLRWSKLGRNFYAVGGNPQSANMLGINVKRTKFLAHFLCSVLAGIGGFVYFLHVGSGSPSHASGYEMNAIASSIIGGTMLTGGVGNIIGTFFGVMSLSTIKNIVSSLGLDEAWWTNITVAAMICVFLVIQSVVLLRKNKK